MRCNSLQRTTSRRHASFPAGAAYGTCHNTPRHGSPLEGTLRPSNFSAAICASALAVISCRPVARVSSPPAGESSDAITTLFAPGQISTGDFELNSTFTPDGRTVLYTKRSPKAQYWVIVESHLVSGVWSSPDVIRRSPNTAPLA